MADIIEAIKATWYIVTFGGTMYYVPLTLVALHIVVRSAERVKGIVKPIIARKLARKRAEAARIAEYEHNLARWRKDGYWPMPLSNGTVIYMRTKPERRNK